MQNELRIYKEINIANCCQIKFSNGGQYMACAWPTMKATNHEITIFQSQTLEKISVLKGQNQAICDMVFTKNDQYPIFTKFFICMWWRGTDYRVEYIPMAKKRNHHHLLIIRNHQ